MEKEKEATLKDLMQEAIKRGLITVIHTDKNGKKHKISEMSDNHLINTINLALKIKKREEFWDAIL